jgi:hypothetical protein
MSKAAAKIKEEFRAILPPTIFFFVALHIVALIRALLIKATGIGIIAGNRKLLAEMIWPHFWAVQLILFIMVLAYCTGCELVRVLGKERVLRMFFGPVPIS